MDDYAHKTFLNDSIKLQLPTSWTKSDTVEYYNPAIYFNAKIFTPDTSSFILIRVDDYSVYPSWDKNFEETRKVVKAKLASFSKNPDAQIYEELKLINGYSASIMSTSYYDELKNNNVFLANIFFIFPAKKYVDIELKITEHEEHVAKEKALFILESLTIK